MSDTPDGWDGVERRRGGQPVEAIGQKVVDAIQSVTPSNNLGQQILYTLVIAAAVVIALQVLILISQFRLADRQTSNAGDAQDFRKSLTCFIVEVSNQTPSKDILTKCGFVTIPGNR